MKQSFLALVLAAGQGTRFKSERNKVLHPVLGKPMLQLVVDCVKKIKPEKIYVVLGHQKKEVMEEMSSPGIGFVHQQKQLGTAHAVLSARKELSKYRDKNVFVINGDLPLITPRTLKPLLSLHQRKGNSLTFLSAGLDDPRGFGRLIRSGDNSIKIIEEKELTPSQKEIKEINAGVYVFKIDDLLKALPEVSNLNRKKEYYLTDVVEILARKKKKVGFCKASCAEEIIGVNTRLELARAAQVLRDRKVRELTRNGVTVYDPQTTWVDLDVQVGRDTVIYASVIIEGKSKVGTGCRIYPFVHLRDTRVGSHVEILNSTFIEGSIIEDKSRIGPFSHLRPNTVIRSGARVGNFVEMKNTVFGSGSKAGHLSYLGDCEVEERVNIGAGTITCNYDGEKKHKTHIEAGSFIGSGTELVAPVRIGRGAYVGAGSTITKDVTPESLVVERSKQIEKSGWAKKKKKKK